MTGKGTVRIETANGDSVKGIRLENTLHVPDLRNNLMSVIKIVDAKCTVTFDKDRAEIKTRGSRDILLIADRIGDLYYIRELPNQLACTSSTVVKKSQLQVWHERLGHLNESDLLEMHQKGAVLGMTIKKGEKLLPCEVCSSGKLTTSSFPKSSQKSTDILDIIHTDLCGPMRTESRGKARYFITFTDDRSRWTMVYFLRNKSDALQIFKEFKIYVENQTGRKIKQLQSDNGKEFCNKEFDDFLKKEGIGRRLTTPHTPQQNGIAERKNRTLVEMARCMIMQSGLPHSFWAEAVSTANYVRNRCITSILHGQTPFEIWYKERPSVKNFRTFGELAYVLDKDPSKGKLEPKGIQCIFVGYDTSAKGYRMWVPNERRIRISRDIKFFGVTCSRETRDEDEAELPAVEIEIENPVDEMEARKPIVEMKVNESLVEVEAEEISERRNIPSVKRGPGRPGKVLTGQRGRPKKKYNLVVSCDGQKNLPKVDDMSIISDKPIEGSANIAETSWDQALRGPDAVEWREAILTEIECLIKNNTWNIVDRPKDHRVIGCRMVLRNKYRPDGTIDKRKARVVAQGFSQRPGIDYHDTFAPVARLSSVRLLMALAVQFDLKVRQLDITTAYLNGKIEEELYMETPKLLIEFLQEVIDRRDKHDPIRRKADRMALDLRSGDKVCRLNKALYGLKQAGRQWYRTLNGRLQQLGLKPTTTDPCVYVTRRGGNILLALVYVDDILVAYHHDADLQYLQKGLQEDFDVKDLDEARYSLGIEIERGKDYIKISQTGYINEVIRRFGMENSNPVKTPTDPCTKLDRSTNNKDKGQERQPYRELVGALNYLAVGTRPDLAYIVSSLSQFNSCHEKQHWIAAKRVLRYLKNTSSYGIIYRKGHKVLDGFTDADWASCHLDRRSYTGYAFILSGGAVSWESRKQRTVALSSTEAEYMSLTEATKEGLYLRKLLKEIGIYEANKISIFCDNRGALSLAENSVYHSRSKHIDLRHHFVRDALKENFIELKYLRTEEMPADVLTKGLPREKHFKCMSLLGMEQSLTE